MDGTWPSASCKRPRPTSLPTTSTPSLRSAVSRISVSRSTKPGSEYMSSTYMQPANEVDQNHQSECCRPAAKPP